MASNAKDTNDYFDCYQPLKILPETAKPSKSYPCPTPPKITPGNPKLLLNYPLSRSCHFPSTSHAAGNQITTFPGVGVGWVGVITRIKANLSSTELGLTSQLELSLAKK